MEATVFYFLMLQKYISSKQKTHNISKDFTISEMKSKPD